MEDFAGRLRVVDPVVDGEPDSLERHEIAVDELVLLAVNILDLLLDRIPMEWWCPKHSQVNELFAEEVRIADEIFAAVCDNHGEGASEICADVSEIRIWSTSDSYSS